MTDQIITSLLQTYGSLGAVLIATGAALKHLFTRLNEVQEKRIAEAQAASAKLLEFVHQQHEQMALLTRAIGSNADATREMSEMFERTIHQLNQQQLPPPIQPGRKTIGGR